MAVPIVKTLQDCADFSKTVVPYLPELYDLPNKVFQSYNDLGQLKELYVATNPLVFSFALSLFLAPIFFIASEVNKNYSQVDRFWSILPTVYNGHYVLWAHLAGLPTLRMDTMMACSGVWTLRLTYNYYRRGGYSIGSEDYRWVVVKRYVDSIAPGLWTVFDLLFIAIIQNLLLWTITTPSYVLLLTSRINGEEATQADIIFSRVMMGLNLLTWFADQQQWKYQNAKAEYKKTAKANPFYSSEDLDRGFCVSGLWAWSRHPNFAAEQAIWVTLYQWATYVAESHTNWTLIGPMLYLILFQCSTWLTELISAKKYPEYAEYQMRVGKFLPRLSSSLPGEDNALSKGIKDAIPQQGESKDQKNGEESG